MRDHARCIHAQALSQAVVRHLDCGRWTVDRDQAISGIIGIGLHPIGDQAAVGIVGVVDGQGASPDRSRSKRGRKGQRWRGGICLSARLFYGITHPNVSTFSITITLPFSRSNTCVSIGGV